MAIEGAAPGWQSGTAPEFGADAPSAKAVECAERAGEELAAAGTAVSVRLLGWGFALRLDQRAADHLAPPDGSGPVSGFPGLVEEALAGSLPAALAEAVGAGLGGRAEQIRSAARGAGCELVSPWAAPTLLAPVALDAPPRESGLWFSVFEPGAGWGPTCSSRPATPPKHPPSPSSAMTCTASTRAGATTPACGGPRTDRTAAGPRISRSPVTTPWAARPWPCSRTGCTARTAAARATGAWR